MAGQEFPLSYGTKVKWAAKTGHVTNAKWEFTASPGPYYEVPDTDTNWVASTITGLYGALTTGITTQPGASLDSVVTSAIAADGGIQGLGGFVQQPSMILDSVPMHAGDYTGTLTLTLT